MGDTMEFLATSEHKIFFNVINLYENENSRAYYPHPLDEKKEKVKRSNLKYIGNKLKRSAPIFLKDKALE